jgi:hypothetical protein
MTNEHSFSSGRPESVRAVAIALGLVAVLSLLLTAFSWPSANLAPRDLPIVVAGPPQATAPVVQGIERARPGAFDVSTVADEQAARTAIEDRDAYGAVVLAPSGTPRVLTASAASPVVAQLLGQLAASLPPASAGQVGTQVVDVVPAPADDPRGTGLAAAALPIALGGVAVGSALVLLVRRPRNRLAGTAVVAVGSGLAFTALLQYWIGALDGPFWREADVFALGLGAVAVVVLGLESLFGRAGLALGAAIMVLLGNPLSGMTSAPELLPTGWGALGRLLPPGATGTLLRDVAFFDGADAGRPILVLTGWLVLGLAVAGVAALRTRPAPAVARELVHAA